jgi:peptide-methionine (S)-S-oxide reductase
MALILFTSLITACGSSFAQEADMSRKDSKAKSLPLPTTTQEAGNNNQVPQSRLEIATLAGGCFWGMQEIIRKIPGVVETEAGYTGGDFPNATYQDVHTGKTGHAEALRITLDPAIISYDQLLEIFFRMHDPTTLNRQGNDRGSQYRSAIFFHSPQQKKMAEQVKHEVDRSGKWPQKVVTQILPAGDFWSAEEVHQDYLQKNPAGYTCHFLRD